MELRQWEVRFMAGSPVTVKAYNISYHRDHIAFTGWNNETIVAYRSENVDTIRKVVVT